ncbi:MAG: nucleotidyl transferase AbiEii/AbiGii toxin family protein [Acidobacteria bacterium]|nr:nucleotidyl transferase AbiEii/AbiGii toxin family protein [Acidobacteriota bacterium]
MDFAEVRRLTIVALFSDDQLFEQIVLKGGNALNLVYGLSSRTSLDLDFSIEKDFADLDDTRKRIFRAVKERFSSAGFVVFDESLEPKPQVLGPNQQAWWGGYEFKFKLIEEAKHKALGESLETIRRNALVVGPDQQRKFSVDMSKFEYCGGKVERELDSYTIYVYSPEMIAVEKLRAICQQMPEYTLRSRASPRARDFYDIWRVITETGLNLTAPEIVELAKHIFAAKQVPLALLAKVRDQREVHRPDWPAVVDAVAESLNDFDFYFDFVVEQVATLKTLWVE